jgi:hypothetical protein
MAKEINGQSLQKVLLEVLNEMGNQGPGQFQQNSVLSEASKRLQLRGMELEQVLLTYWYDLFRNGYLAWGYNLTNPDPPFCHLTEQGRRALRNLSHDPANPDGYLAYIDEIGRLNPIADSYIREALKSYNSDCIKATAVLVGIAMEIILLELRDVLVEKIKSNGHTPKKELLDWRTKIVIDELTINLESRKSDMPRQNIESLDALWAAMTYQIRTTRNDAGHPKDIATVSAETVHGSLLIFPELYKFVCSLKNWIISKY